MSHSKHYCVASATYTKSHPCHLITEQASLQQAHMPSDGDFAPHVTTTAFDAERDQCYRRGLRALIKNNLKTGYRRRSAIELF